MIPPPARPPVAHPGEQFQQVTAIRCRAEGSEPPARQAIGEQGCEPPVRHEAATGNDTIEHGEAPADEGLWEDTSYYRGFALLHDQVRQADIGSRHNGTSHQPGTASASLRTILKRPGGPAPPCPNGRGYRLAGLVPPHAADSPVMG